MTRPLRLAGYIALGVVTGLLLATIAIVVLTRTDWGMERARRFAVEWLADRVDGELHITRISGGGLLGGVVLHDFGITDPRGRPFLSTDSAELAYDWRTLIRGRIVLNRVILYRPQVAIEKLPGDTVWNYELVFPDTTPGPASTERSLIMFRDARIVDGMATVRTPFAPDGPIEPSDTARVMLEQVAGGTVRTMRIDNINANLDRVIWESPLEKGRLIDVRSVSGRVFVWEDPILLQDARGTITLRDSVVAFDMPEVELPSSMASMIGRVTMGAGGNDLDVRVEGRRLRFSDLQWLHPGLPEEGGGSVVLRIRTQPDGILWLAEDANISTPGSRVAGSVGVVMGDTMYFTRVNLRASPLDVQLLEQLVPGGLPIDGLLVGTVEVTGPLSALETKGDMQLAGTGPGAGSHVAWNGVVDVRDGGFDARSLHADVRHLELSLLESLRPGLKLGGSVSGTFDGSGRLDRMRFTAALDHASDDGGRSRFDGGGTVMGQGRNRTFDLTVNATPVTLEDLAGQIPALRGLQGELTGPVHLTGSAADLGFTAQLGTPGGALSVSGRMQQAEGRAPRITAEAKARNFALDAFREDLPSTRVWGVISADLTGRDLATLAGPVHMYLDSARVGQLPYARVSLDGSLGDGVLTVDSALLSSVAGTGRARGRVALVAGRDERLEVGFSSQSLNPLEPYLFADEEPLPEGERRVDGRVDALLTLTGEPGAYTVEASADGTGLVYGTFAAGALELRMDGSGIGSDASRFRLAATADSFAVWRHTVPHGRLDASGSPTDMVIALLATDSGDADVARAGAHLTRTDSGFTLRVDSLGLGSVSPWTLAAPATIAVMGGEARVDRLELARARGGRAIAAGRLGWAEAAETGRPVDFSVDLSGVPFADVLRATGATGAGSGSVEGRMRLYGAALDPLLEAEIFARDVVYGDLRLDQAFAELSYSGLGLDAHAEAQYGGRSILTGGGRIPLDLRLTPVDERRLDQPLRFSIRADSLPPALPLNLLDGFSNTGGRIDGEIVAGGTTLDPALSGGFTITGGTADWNVSGVRYADVNGSLTLERDRVLRVDLNARAEDPRNSVVRSLAGLSAGGNGTVSGTLDFADLTDPLFDLRIFTSRAYGLRRREAEASVTGVAYLEGRYSTPIVRGRLRVDEGTLYVDEILRQFYVAAVEFDDQRLMSLVDTSLVAVRPLLAGSRNPFLRALRVDGLELEVGANSWLRSQDMDVEVTGDLTVDLDRQSEDMRLSGALNVERGTYTLYFPPFISRRFRVSEGTIEFTGTPGIDPNLSITAEYRARIDAEPLDVVAGVTGTLQTPRIRLSSQGQPNVSESDLASLLFFGVRTWELVGTGGSQNEFRAVTGRALQPSLFGYASSGLQTLVQNAGLLDYISLTAGDVLPTDRDAGLFAGTRLELGRYLPWGNVYVGYTQRLSSANLDAGARMEWRFLPEYSLELFAEDRLARTPGFGLRQEMGQKKVYGFSLFREWGF